MKVKQMNKQERPREKAMMEGIQALSNRELIAILLRSGNKTQSVLDLADEVLHMRKDLVSLMDLQLDELMQINGIKQAKATQLLACFELGRRISYDRMKQNWHAEQNPQILSEWLMNHIGHEKQEHFVVLFLNNHAEMIAHKDLFIGTGSKSFANPREVFMEALHYGTSKIICAHNHPSGHLLPSNADRQSADAMEQCGELLGIQVLDHLIVSARNYYSFREHYEMRDQRKLLEQKLLQQIDLQNETS